MSGLFGLSGGGASTDNAQSNAFISPDLAGMLGSNSIVNDTCFRSDNNKIYTLLDEPASIEANWKMHNASSQEENSFGIMSADYELGINENPQQIFYYETNALVTLNRIYGGDIGFWNLQESKFTAATAGKYLINSFVNASSVFDENPVNKCIYELSLMHQTLGGINSVSKTTKSIKTFNPQIEQWEESITNTKTVQMQAGESIYLNFKFENQYTNGSCTLLEKSLCIQKVAL